MHARSDRLRRVVACRVIKTKTFFNIIIFKKGLVIIAGKERSFGYNPYKPWRFGSNGETIGAQCRIKQRQ